MVVLGLGGESITKWSNSQSEASVEGKAWRIVAAQANVDRLLPLFRRACTEEHMVAGWRAPTALMIRMRP
jgi:hypothetical protein